jgi:hypothetical protein
MTYYAPRPFKQDDGTYRATDTDGNVAIGNAEKEAQVALWLIRAGQRINNSIDAFKRLADK